MITGRTFFPHLISDPFRHGLAIAFGVSIAMLLIAAVASLMRGERYVHADAEHRSRRWPARATRCRSRLIPGEDVAYDDALAASSP